MVSQIVSQDTDVFLEALLKAPKFENQNLVWENLGQEKIRVNVTTLHHRIKSDARISNLKFPVESLVFAMALSGNDLTGGFHGIGSATFFSSFLRYPRDLLLEEGERPSVFGEASPQPREPWPSFYQAQEFIKCVYFCKNEKLIRKRVIDSERSSFFDALSSSPLFVSGTKQKTILESKELLCFPKLICC